MRRLLAAGLFAALVAVGCGGDDEPAASADDGGDGRSVTVFAAASLTDVFEQLAAAFEDAHPGTAVELSFGPSSGIVTQVAEGAPADVVALASTTDMDDLAGFLGGEPTAFAANRLELAVPPGNPAGVAGLADLADDDLVVGLCQEEAPCGRLAREALDAAGVEPSIDSNEEDVRALLTKVAAGEVDVGVVYRTDVIAAGDAVEGIALPDDEDVVATYPIATVEGASAGAQDLVDLVLSTEGQAALAEAGFETVPS